MDAALFWNLIDQTRQTSGGDQSKQLESLVELLIELSDNEMLEWDTIFHDRMDEAYIAELWEVAYIIGCGCGDDGFNDFRAWLIGQGKDTYEMALNDPESLVTVVNVGDEDQVYSSSLWSAYLNAYFRKGGKDYDEIRSDEIPVSKRPTPELKGEPSLNEDAILLRFPKATARFWQRCRDIGLAL